MKTFHLQISELAMSSCQSANKSVVLTDKDRVTRLLIEEMKEAEGQTG